ncbi:hypothetical protein D3C86_1729720 [compost metagenome]
MVPFPSQCLKAALTGKPAGDLLLLADKAGVVSFGDHSASFIPFSSRFFQGHIRINAQGELLFLSRMTILEFPILAGLVN